MRIAQGCGQTSDAAEQGYICAYTMQAMQMADDCHIEHVVPRKPAKPTAEP